MVPAATVWLPRNGGHTQVNKRQHDVNHQSLSPLYSYLFPL